VYRYENRTNNDILYEVKRYRVESKVNDNQDGLKTSSNIKRVRKIIKECQNRGVNNIIIPASLSGVAWYEDEASDTGHAILIYMTKRAGKWITYYFDPNGVWPTCEDCYSKEDDWVSAGNASFCQACKDFPNVQSPTTYCFKDTFDGPQPYDSRGTCQYWSLLMVYLLLRNPKTEPQQVIQAMKNKDSAKSLMNGFLMDTWNHFNSRLAEENRLRTVRATDDNRQKFKNVYDAFFVQDVYKTLQPHMRFSKT
jgi:hypothetical protein